MKKIILIFLVSLIASCNTVNNISEKENSKTITNIPIDSMVKTGVLSNGMTYYIRQNPKPEQKVEFRLVVKAGSILENEKQLGLAHFMEHMNFNGSKNFDKNELVSYLQSIGVKFGAHLNAYTSFDETVYILPIPTDDDEKLEKGIQIIEDWAFNASLTNEEIDKERGVVLEEYRLGLGADKRMMKEYLPKLMHNSHYAERLPIGTKEVLENFTYDDLKNFYKDWYRPDLMAVIAVGDVDVHVLEQKIKTHFEKYPAVKKPKERKQYDVPNHEETFVAIETDPEASRSIIRLYYKDLESPKPIVSINDYKKYLTENLFSQMLNQRLQELTNHENPPFIYGYSAHGNTWAKTKQAYQSVALTSETGQLQALKALATENERVLRYGFNDSELNRAKEALLKSTENAFQEKDKTESNRYAGEYIQNFLEASPIPGIQWELEAVKNLLPNISIDDCNNLVHKYIHNNNRVVVLTGPEKEGLNNINEAAVLTILENVKHEKIEPYKDVSFTDGLMKEMPKKGNISNILQDTILHTTTLTLNNGVKVTYKKTNFKNNQILFSAYKYGGTSLYSDEEYLKTDLATNALTESSLNGYSKTDLNKLLTGKLVSVNPYINKLSQGFNGSTTPEDFETLFQLTNLFITKLDFDQKAYNSHKNKTQAYLKNILSNPSTYFSVEFSNFLNQNNKRYIGLPTDKDWENTDFKLAYEKYNQLFSNANGFHFYFVGSFDENKLKEYAETYLASLPATDTVETYKNVETKPLTGTLEKIISKGTEPKSLVNIIYQGVTDDNIKDAYVLKSLGELLTIKLIEELRESEGGVYGVRARGSMNKLPFATYNFSISFPCGPENVEKLKAKTFEEIEKIKNDGVSEKDLNKIKETQLLELKEAVKTNRYWLNQLKDIDYNQNDKNEILQAEEKIKNLSAQDLQKIAKKYLTKNRIIGILNPEK
ncbi:peptidase M16 [Wenyingzhuangia fucanilytica]|uniref:Peptidase M16 n=1 Tax=Wenyingzhuangia fucanilytica TaxID=1790137 RepID=A0A1B1Y786_9FLAO|nr:insulinase family protein [Wenyingzhuangia fucanilytica]ANW96607.1 peptidase M16 [Wenyingzhuangia fucanilytica]